MTKSKATDVVLARAPDPYSAAITAYSVTISGKPAGFVWSRRVLSYRGSQGWNRGIRLADFHPLEWNFGVRLGHKSQRSVGRTTRKRAVACLLETLNEH